MRHDKDPHPQYFRPRNNKLHNILILRSNINSLIHGLYGPIHHHMECLNKHLIIIQLKHEDI